mmetsp:Transcript_16398/g.24708  ORF Transcript_16398/g.24708 Transcript_16398/m.24708 type:complete len:806 (-) Transcript_16398:185-2602(-)
MPIYEQLLSSSFLSQIPLQHTSLRKGLNQQHQTVSCYLTPPCSEWLQRVRACVQELRILQVQDQQQQESSNIFDPIRASLQLLSPLEGWKSRPGLHCPRQTNTTSAQAATLNFAGMASASLRRASPALTHSRIHLRQCRWATSSSVNDKKKKLKKWPSTTTVKKTASTKISSKVSSKSGGLGERMKLKLKKKKNLEPAAKLKKRKRTKKKKLTGKKYLEFKALQLSMLPEGILRRTSNSDPVPLEVPSEDGAEYFVPTYKERNLRLNYGTKTMEEKLLFGSGLTDKTEKRLELKSRGNNSIVESINTWKLLGCGKRCQRIFGSFHSTDELIHFISEVNSEGGVKPSLDGLRCFIDEYMTPSEKKDALENAFPKIIRLASLGKDSLTLPVLSTGLSKPLDVTRREIACSLAGQFLGDFVRQTSDPFDSSISPQKVSKTSQWDVQRSMLEIYRRKEPNLNQFEKFRCLMSYLVQMCDVLFDGEESFGDQIVTFHRKSCLHPIMSLETLTRPNTQYDVPLSRAQVIKGPIAPDSKELRIQNCFASPVIGMGFFSTASGQEEMMLSMYPEALMLSYIMEPLEDHEIAAVIGAHKFNDVTGVGFNMTYERSNSLEKDPLPNDLYDRKANCLVFMDALEVSGVAEYGMETLLRESLKAHTGFSLHPITLGEHYPAVATGNWGGGYAGGDPQYRFLIQWIAASFAGRELRYHVLEDDDELCLPSSTEMKTDTPDEKGLDEGTEETKEALTRDFNRINATELEELIYLMAGLSIPDLIRNIASICEYDSDTTLFSLLRNTRNRTASSDPWQDP